MISSYTTVTVLGNNKPSSLGISKKSEKVHFLKCIFVLQKYFGPPKLLPHVKIKSKLSYLGNKNSILHRQMTEKLSFEVDVKNIMHAQMEHKQLELLFYLFRIIIRMVW